MNDLIRSRKYQSQEHENNLLEKDEKDGNRYERTCKHIFAINTEKSNDLVSFLLRYASQSGRH